MATPATQAAARARSLQSFRQNGPARLGAWQAQRAALMSGAPQPPVSAGVPVSAPSWFAATPTPGQPSQVTQAAALPVAGPAPLAAPAVAPALPPSTIAPQAALASALSAAPVPAAASTVLSTGVDTAPGADNSFAAVVARLQAMNAATPVSADQAAWNAKQQNFTAANSGYGTTGYFGTPDQVAAQVAGGAQSSSIPQGVLDSSFNQGGSNHGGNQSLGANGIVSAGAPMDPNYATPGHVGSPGYVPGASPAAAGPAPLSGPSVAPTTSPLLGSPSATGPAPISRPSTYTPPAPLLTSSPTVGPSPLTANATAAPAQSASATLASAIQNANNSQAQTQQNQQAGTTNQATSNATQAAQNNSQSALATSIRMNRGQQGTAITSANQQKTPAANTNQSAADARAAQS